MPVETFFRSQARPRAAAPSITARDGRREGVLRRGDPPVVDLLAEEVSGRVDQRSLVNGENVAEEVEGHRDEEIFAPEEPGHGDGEGEEDDDHQGNVEPPLEGHHGVCSEVGEVDRPLLGQVLRMRVHHRPADVREEEAAAGVVRIGVRVGPLVRQRIAEHEEDAKGQTGLVRPVRPQAVGAADDPRGAELNQHEEPQQRGHLGVGDAQHQANDCIEVTVRHEGDHRPVQAPAVAVADGRLLGKMCCFGGRFVDIVNASGFNDFIIDFGCGRLFLLFTIDYFWPPGNRLSDVDGDDGRCQLCPSSDSDSHQQVFQLMLKLMKHKNQAKETED
ncbi:hypothetical protein TYRP_015378 [Tyrophagus putrescentiae]|nr:hypothetical protein TYRP_015378 [Tyrophagus putrescentiae]